MAGYLYRLLCEELAASGNLEWLDKTKRRALVFWRTPAQIGTEIYRYIPYVFQDEAFLSYPFFIVLHILLTSSKCFLITGILFKINLSFSVFFLNLQKLGLIHDL